MDAVTIVIIMMTIDKDTADDLVALDILYIDEEGHYRIGLHDDTIVDSLIEL